MARTALSCGPARGMVSRTRRRRSRARLGDQLAPARAGAMRRQPVQLATSRSRPAAPVASTTAGRMTRARQGSAGGGGSQARGPLAGGRIASARVEQVGGPHLAKPLEVGRLGETCRASRAMIAAGSASLSASARRLALGEQAARRRQAPQNPERAQGGGNWRRAACGSKRTPALSTQGEHRRAAEARRSRRLRSPNRQGPAAAGRRASPGRRDGQASRLRPKAG